LFLRECWWRGPEAIRDIRDFGLPVFGPRGLVAEEMNLELGRERGVVASNVLDRSSFLVLVLDMK
jgi:hypothetical protein